MNPLPVVLSVAGSDSGGGAGIQADLKAMTALDCFATTALTCVTAQNPHGVLGVESVDPGMVSLQMRAVFDAFPVAAIKTGMLYSSEIVSAVATALEENEPRNGPLVVDPVMVATSGADLMMRAAAEVLAAELLPLASLITPNIPEACALLGMHGELDTVDAQKEAALALYEKFGCSVALKGGHMTDAGEVIDVLVHKGMLHEFAAPRVACRESHGTGCTFASACAAILAKGESLPNAVEAAKLYVTEALKRARPCGEHWPLGVGPWPW